MATTLRVSGARTKGKPGAGAVYDARGPPTRSPPTPSSSHGGAAGVNQIRPVKHRWARSYMYHRSNPLQT